MQVNRQTREIKNVEVFRAGDYGAKGCYSAQDLAAIASAYDPAKAEAPVTIDHAQKGPAFGWIKALRAEAGKLFADLGEITPEFFDALEKKMFKKRSIELFKDKRFKALSFLGAAPPHVEGMADIQFAANARQFEFAAEAESDQFHYDDPVDLDDYLWPEYTPESDPFPGTHGPIEEESQASDILGHCHYVYLDSKGNGFTSPMIVWDSLAGKYLLKPDSHAHQVQRREIFESASPVPHTHEFTLTKTYNATPKETVKMSDATVVKPEDHELLKKQLDELSAKFSAVQEENAKIKADAYRREQEVKFAAVETALAGQDVKLSPELVAKAKAIYFALPADDDCVVKFSESESAGVRESFASLLTALPVLFTKGATVIDEKRFEQREAKRNDETLHDKTIAFQAEQAKQGIKMDYSEALIEVDKREKLSK